MFILIAEDNPMNQRLFELVCQAAGYQTRTASNGAAAVAEIERGGIRLVLMDVMMPEVDGIEATRRIRRLSEPANSVPILAISANGTEENRRACLEAGVNEFLVKPVRSEILLNRISSLLSQTPHLGATPF